MSCTKLHGDITIAILAEKQPKTIYNMVAFEFYNTVAIQLKLRVLGAKLALYAFEKGSNGQAIITMQFFGGKYPKSIYGMGILEFFNTLEKIQRINRG